MKQNETAASGALAEIGLFAKHETATRNHVRTLAERIETGLASAVEALGSAGAARMPSSATYGVALAHVSAEVWANPAWTRAKSHESGSEERADEARESADFAASQALMNVAPAHQAPYRAEVIIRSAGAIVHAEVLMVIGIAGCETEPRTAGYPVPTSSDYWRRYMTVVLTDGEGTADNDRQKRAAA